MARLYTRTKSLRDFLRFIQSGRVFYDLEYVVIPALEDAHLYYFENQVSPEGESWAPISEATAIAKGHDTILVSSNKLRASLTETLQGVRNVFYSTEYYEIVFGTDVEYAVYHQYGTKNMPARPMIGLTEETADKILEDSADHILERIKNL